MAKKANCGATRQHIHCDPGTYVRLVAAKSHKTFLYPYTTSCPRWATRSSLSHSLLLSLALALASALASAASTSSLTSAIVLFLLRARRKE